MALYSRWEIVVISNATLPPGASFVHASFNGSGGADIRCYHSASGATISVTANDTTAGGDPANYWLTVVYNMNGKTFKGEGQTVIINSSLTCRLGTGYSVALLANGVSLGSIPNGISEFVLPNDGANYTLQFQIYASAINYEWNRVTLTINELKIH